jgi:hypothetical protein
MGVGGYVGVALGRSHDSVGFFSFQGKRTDRASRILLGFLRWLPWCGFAMIVRSPCEGWLGFFQRNGRGSPQRAQWNSNTFVNALGAYRSVGAHWFNWLFKEIVASLIVFSSLPFFCLVLLLCDGCTFASFSDHCVHCVEEERRPTPRDARSPSVSLADNPYE